MAGLGFARGRAAGEASLCRMACEQCGASQSDFFTTEGLRVCRRCYDGEQTSLQDARAQASIAEGLPEGIAQAKDRRPPKPGRVLAIGLAFAGLGLAANGVYAFVMEGISLALLAILGFGVVTSVQGYRTRHFQ
jgi:hypothetical protein